MLWPKEQPLAARYVHHSLPEEVVISTELSSGLGRRLPCYNTSQCAIVVKKENTAVMPEITDERLKDGSTKNKKCSGQSVAYEESQGEKKLTLDIKRI